MLLRPTYSVDGDITDLDIERLYEDGIRGLILDLDSTLMAPKAGKLTSETEKWLTQARNRFKMMVLSNNKKLDYLDCVKLVLEMEIIGKAAKPFPGGFRQALAILELPPDAVVVIGDRPLTDILGGQLSSLKTVLVRAHRSINEPRWKTRLRNIERLLIKT